MGDLLGEVGGDDYLAGALEQFRAPIPVHVIEQALRACVDVEVLPPARQEVAVRLGQGAKVEPGHQSGIRDRLEVHVPVGRSALQLDHDEAPGRVQPQHVQPVARGTPSVSAHRSYSAVTTSTDSPSTCGWAARYGRGRLVEATVKR